MVIERFIPRILTNGIINKNYKTEEDIKVEVSSIQQGFDAIYKTAIFEDNYFSYYQSIGFQSYITLTFKKYIFISHFAIRPHISFNKQWCPPKNISLTSCLEGMCTISHKEEASEKYETTEMVLTTVTPSVSNVFNFSMSGVGTCQENPYWHTINRIEIFGIS